MKTYNIKLQGGGTFKVTKAKAQGSDEPMYVVRFPRNNVWTEQDLYKIVVQLIKIKHDKTGNIEDISI